MRLLIEPSREKGRAYLSVLSDCPNGRFVLLDADIPLDPEARWVKTVARHVSTMSGGAITSSRVIRVVRDATVSADGARWPR